MFSILYKIIEFYRVNHDEQAIYYQQSRIKKLKTIYISAQEKIKMKSSL